MTDLAYAPTSPTCAGPVALALSTAIAATPVAWPTNDTSKYTIVAAASSYSAFTAKAYTLAEGDTETPLMSAVTKLYSKLLDTQQALGEEFERVWDDNEDRLFDW